MGGPESAALPGLSWTVSALLLAVTDTLAVRFGAVAVNGELTGFVRASSGHCYFSLKDAGGAPGLIRCAMFRRAATLLDFQPADGQQVELRGRIGVYEPRGELQLVVESLRRQGAGSLYEEFLRLRARLEAQGLFDPARRRPVVPDPRAVGIVTSLGAAALHDVLTALRRRAPHVRAIVYPSLVQGAEAPAALVAALATANVRHEVETLLLVRGGGSLEDLWAFNDERVVRAVADSRIPVICGVGHETDVTLCDLAADLRAATPTAAAELAAPASAELAARVDRAAAALATSLRRTVERQAQRLDLLAQAAGRPAVTLSLQRRRLDALAPRLSASVGRRVQAADLVLPALAQRMQRAARVLLNMRGERLQAASARLYAAHPQQVLERGFAWVLGADGDPVTLAAQLEAGQAVQAVFADGRALATIDRVDLGPA